MLPMYRPKRTLVRFVQNICVFSNGFKTYPGFDLLSNSVDYFRQRGKSTLCERQFGAPWPFKQSI
jgi:hypothetical protein